MNQNRSTSMAKLLNGFLLLVVLFVLLSCDCGQDVSANIFDEQTKKPLEKVQVQNVYKNWCNTETDSAGFFSLSATSGGLFGCPPMQIIIAKRVYYMKVVKIEDGKYERIYLTKKDRGY